MGRSLKYPLKSYSGRVYAEGTPPAYVGAVLQSRAPITRFEI